MSKEEWEASKSETEEYDIDEEALARAWEGFCIDGINADKK